MRGSAVTLLVALGACGVVLALAWTVQAASLRPPERGDRTAIRALTVLDRYRHVRSRIRLDGGAVTSGRCDDGWFAKKRGSLLRLDDGRRIFAGARSHLTPPDLLELELAGCPRVLVPRLETLLEDGAPVEAGRGWVRIDGPHTDFTFFVEPRLGAPLALAIEGARGAGRSRLALGGA